MTRPKVAGRRGTQLELNVSTVTCGRAQPHIIL